MNEGPLNHFTLCFWNLKDTYLVTDQTKNLLEVEIYIPETRRAFWGCQSTLFTSQPCPAQTTTTNDILHSAHGFFKLNTAEGARISLDWMLLLETYLKSYIAIHSCSKSDETWNNCSSSMKSKFSVKMFVPANDLSSWQRAKSHTLTVVSSEQEQNLRSVLEKLKQQQIQS